MSSDTILTDAAGTRYSYDNLRTQGYLDGHRPGAEAAAGFLKDKAVELFKAGRDAEATAMRKLAEEMLAKVGAEMDRRAKVHEKEYPIELEKDSGREKKR